MTCRRTSLRDRLSSLFRVRSLRARIMLMVLALLTLVQAAGFLSIRAAIEAHARRSVGEQLRVGERMFQRLVEQNAAKLAQGARVLAADYGFRAAVASGDHETVASALQNHGARIGATLNAYYTADGTLRSSSMGDERTGRWILDRAGVLRLIDAASREGWASTHAVAGGRVYEVVAVPVRAPLLIGWVMMGFAIDVPLINDMRALASLDLSFVRITRDGARWLESGQDPATRAMMAALPAPLPGEVASARWRGDEIGTLAVAMPSDGALLAVLQRSISDAAAPFTRLQVTLALLTLTGLALSVVASMFTARRVIGPLRALARNARDLGAGRYESTVAEEGDQEIVALARAFNRMRDDIAQREGQITRLAYWDRLTGLPNRDRFLEQLGEAIASARAAGEACAVLMLDLDRFKHVNDVLGHAFGDALLTEVARRLEGVVVRAGDQVARLGGDEFAVLLPRQDIARARLIAERVHAAMQVPIQVAEHLIDMSAGIGIAAFPDDADDAPTLLSRVEVAMYAAKQRQAGVLAYDAAYDQGSEHTLSMLTELRRAVAADELVLYFQPKLALADGAVTGVETLVRWIHPQRGFVPPGDFIPFAEQTGFITEITRWVMDKSVEQAARWGAAGESLLIAVNLSTRDLMNLDLPQRFAAMLERHGVAAGRFCLEITESAIMDDPQRAQGTLDALHAMGFRLSIDDFGTGYSSLAYLKRLPVDELKIDRSFVAGMETDRDDAIIVRSTIDLGHNMGLKVVAEGIENEAIWHLLRQAGCDTGQGYFMSKPLPAAQFDAWRAAWQAPRAVQPAPLRRVS